MALGSGVGLADFGSRVNGVVLQLVQMVYLIVLMKMYLRPVELNKVEQKFMLTLIKKR